MEHRLAPLALDEPTQLWLQQQLLPVVYWQTQVEKTKTPALKTAYQQAFRQAQAALLQHPLTATVTPSAFETYHAWASDLAEQFQRASSAVEGRIPILDRRPQRMPPDSSTSIPLPCRVSCTEARCLNRVLRSTAP